MMKSEFIERTGFEPTAAEYEEIEAEYMGCDIDKDQFCKEWKKNGGVQRLSRQRARRIEELEAEIARKDREYKEMDLRHCEEFNAMYKSLTEKVKNITKDLEGVQKRCDFFILEHKAAEEEKKRVKDQLETIKAAFVILGLRKEGE